MLFELFVPLFYRAAEEVTGEGREQTTCIERLQGRVELGLLDSAFFVHEAHAQPGELKDIALVN